MHLSVEERERFLAGAHIGVLSVVASWEAAPLAVPVWYAYEPGDVVRFSTETDERALETVRRAGRATLTVQEELPPYRCVSVEGSVIIYEPTDPAEFRQWVVHCLGEEPGDRYYRAVEDDLEHMTTVRLLPGNWRTRDIGLV